MEKTSLRCPSCGGVLDVDENKEFCFCLHCGHKILLNDENKKTYRIIDEAKIKAAEGKTQVEMKELEIIEMQEKNGWKSDLVVFVFFAFALVVFLIMHIMGYIK